MWILKKPKIKMKYENVVQIDMDMYFDTISKYISSDEKINIFDIGSRDGKDAKKLLSFYPNSNVYAFEASPMEYESFREENSNINWINLAIYDKEEEITLYVKGYLSGVHSLRNKSDIIGSEIKVLTKRIDSFCLENNISSIDVVKLDVEGCSYEVLKSFGDLLSNVKTLHVETETIQYFEGQFLEDSVFNLLLKDFIMVEKNFREEVKQSDSIWINKKLLNEESN
jgi:FkbM family methyltransferase